MAVETIASTLAPEQAALESRTGFNRHSKLVPSIIDIRTVPRELDLAQEIHSGLRPSNGGEKTLPTLLLYDERGLKLFEKITYLDEYYLTNAEISVLEKYSDRIAERIQDGSILMELGSGYEFLLCIEAGHM
jgi:L-histidine Nalpha-methyltransferase / hercynylcysteine S-oxide synthase